MVMALGGFDESLYPNEENALMDGLDVGRFFERFQALLDDPTALTT